MRLLSLVVLALVAPAALAQEPVTLAPGHPDLAVEAVPLDEATTYSIRAEAAPGADLIEVGTVRETVTLADGVLTVVSVADTPGGAARDSSRMAWPSLAPLSDDATSGDEAQSAVYADGRVTGTFDGGRGPLPFEFDLRRPVFSAAAAAFVAQALPLDRAGYRAVVPTFSAGDRFKEATLTVAGLETVTVDGAAVEAVAVDQAGGGGLSQGLPTRYYVDPETRALVLIELKPPGATLQVVPLSAEAVAQAEADAAAAAAQAEAARAGAVRLVPGHPDLVAAGPQSATLVVRLVAPVAQDLGTIATTEALDGDRLVFTSDVSIPQAGQEQRDSTVVAFPSLAPVSRVERSADAEERAGFADGRMTGTVTEGGETREVSADVAGVFGPGITRRLARSLPFTDGYVASFAQVDGDGEVSESLMTVSGPETVTVGGAERTAWRVVESEGGSPDSEYFIDAETRALLRVAFAPQPGVRVEMDAE